METSFRVTLPGGITLRLEPTGAYLADRHYARFLDLLEAATIAGALHLAPSHHAALVMLDELRGRFAMNELAAARRLGASCIDDLQQAFGVSEIAGDAIVGRPITRDPQTLAWLVEYAMAVALTRPSEAIARVRSLVRLAADLDGGPRSSLETRPDHVRRHLFDRPPPSGIEEIALPVPAIHPAMWSEVADHLGLTIEEATEQLVYAPDARERVMTLPETMLLRAVPRVPLDERPARVFPPRDRFGTASVIEDPLTTCLDRVAMLTREAQTALDPDAPEILAMVLQSRVQGAIERLATIARVEDDPYAATAWELEDPGFDLWLDAATRESERIVDHDNPAAASCVWLTDDTVALAVDGVAHVRAIATAVEHRAFPIGDLRLQACDASGRYLLVGPSVGLVDYLPGTGFGCRDLDADDWLETLPPELPAVTYLHEIHEPHPGDNRNERAFLIDYRTAAEIEVEPPEDATRVCFARGNAAVMVASHGLRATATGFVEIAPAVVAARAADDAVLVHHTPAKVGEPRRVGAATACAKFGEAWRFLLSNGNVADGDHTLFRIAWTVCAASFSPDGRRLLVVGEHDTVVIDVEGAAVTHVLPDR